MQRLQSSQCRPVRGAARSGAPQTRDLVRRHGTRSRVCSAPLRAALRPGRHCDGGYGAVHRERRLLPRVLSTLAPIPEGIGHARHPDALVEADRLRHQRQDQAHHWTKISASLAQELTSDTERLDRGRDGEFRQVAPPREVGHAARHADYGTVGLSHSGRHDYIGARRQCVRGDAKRKLSFLLLTVHLE
jgi:hypothetical protein